MADEDWQPADLRKEQLGESYIITWLTAECYPDELPYYPGQERFYDNPFAAPEDLKEDAIFGTKSLNPPDEREFIMVEQAPPGRYASAAIGDMARKSAFVIFDGVLNKVFYKGMVERQAEGYLESEYPNLRST